MKDLRWTGLALVAATALSGGAWVQIASAQVASTRIASPQGAAPAIRRDVAVSVAPVNTVPDAGETDGSGVGPEQREAMAAPADETAGVMASTLNAQMAMLQPPDPAPTASAAAPAMAPVALQAGAPAPVAAVYQAPAEASAPAAELASYAVASPAFAPPALASPALALTSATAQPSVALARRVVESAFAFADYMQRASAVRPTYADAAGVAFAVKTGGAYEFSQIQEGAVAYVALAALQDPEFVSAVDNLARSGQPGLAEQLAADPRLIMQVQGSAPAAARAAMSLGRMGAALEAAGAAVKQSAYDIQQSAWSRTSVAGPQAMLAELKARSAQREALGADGGRLMLTSLIRLRGQTDGGQTDGGQDEGGSGRLTPVVSKGLTLAALAVLGEAGEQHAERVSALLGDAASAQCLKMARLNLYQCLSVAGPNYEDVFCLGRHAMMDTGRCVTQASGWAAADQGISFPIARPAAPRVEAAAQPASIMVPVAFVSDRAEPAALGDPADQTPAGAPPPTARGGYGQIAAWSGGR